MELPLTLAQMVGEGIGRDPPKLTLNADQQGHYGSGLQQRTLQRILHQWHSRVWDPCTLSSSPRTTSSPKLLGSISGGESALEKVPRDPAIQGTLLVTFLWATGQRRQKQHLMLWQARAQQVQSAVRRYQHTLQRRILLSWSHWTTAQGARRELADRWAWARNCRVALGLWRQRLVQWLAAERWAQERDRGLARNALHHWHSCWQRQWVLHEKYQAWTQVHLQSLRSVVFQGWWRAAARQRLIMTRTEELRLQSHFQAWRGLVREAGVLQAQCQAFQDSQLKRAIGAAFTVWWADQAQEQRMARATITHQSRAMKQSQAQQAFSVCPGTPHQHHKAHRQAKERAQVQAGVTLCWTLWVHETHLRQVSRAHAARKLSIRVLEAWAQVAAQARVQKAAFAQLRQARSRLLLWTHWAQWQTALLRMRLGAQTEMEETCRVHLRPRAGLRHCLSLASRGRLLLMEVPAQDQQDESTVLAPRITASPAPGLPADQLLGSCVAVLGRCLQGRAVGADPVQVVAPEMGLGDVAATDLAAAFEKWHKRLAARGRRSGANSSLRPPGKLGSQSPGTGQEDAGALDMGGRHAPIRNARLHEGPTWVQPSLEASPGLAAITM
ncbi:PREDICTED: uncharacterized protein C1orf167-like [Chrysochloris asiatica]|uniref:Uncharacterized protein C1orf167-like n=1 Tax=Chrysochloris asiatica TaxID=185453 RepID=A0A9B0WSN2_CHRAS|nr:PREDICTED: uncharacterized protein C1orf167-like [Chrysochloris asiatica]